MKKILASLLLSLSATSAMANDVSLYELITDTGKFVEGKMDEHGRMEYQLYGRREDGYRCMVQILDNGRNEYAIQEFNYGRGSFVSTDILNRQIRSNKLSINGGTRSDYTRTITSIKNNILEVQQKDYVMGLISVDKSHKCSINLNNL